MIPAPGQFGEPWKITHHLGDSDRARACVNALDGCDPSQLGQLIKAVRRVGNLVDVPKNEVEDEAAHFYLCEAIDAFTARES